MDWTKRVRSGLKQPFDWKCYRWQGQLEKKLQVSDTEKGQMILSLSHLRFFRWAQLAQRNKGIVESARYASLQVHVTAWIFVCKSSRNGTIDET